VENLYVVPIFLSVTLALALADLNLQGWAI